MTCSETDQPLSYGRGPVAPSVLCRTETISFPSFVQRHDMDTQTRDLDTGTEADKDTDTTVAPRTPQRLVLKKYLNVARYHCLIVQGNYPFERDASKESIKWLITI